MLREVIVRVDGDSAEALADALLAAGALSVGIVDADAGSDAERPLFGEPGVEPQCSAWPRNLLQILVPVGADPAQLIASAAQAVGASPPPVQAVAQVEDADWVRATQAQFPPIRIADGVWIVPSWHEPPEPAAINIRLDPGVAFGTGTHATTRLCLQWIAAHPPRGQRVLDYGCGSGILSIVAARLGAREVVGTDIDEQALRAARSNAERNAVAGQYTAPDLLPAGPFDLVVANILANPLKLLAPLLLERTARGGRLLLSGVLQRQALDLIDCYARIDPAVPLAVAGVQDGWVLLAGTRG